MKEEQVDELNKLFKDICKDNARVGEQQRPNKLSIDDIERSTIEYHKRIINSSLVFVNRNNKDEQSYEQ